MPRYYFHATNGCQILDQDGETLDGPDAARTVATRVMSELLEIRRHTIWLEGSLCVSVKDEAGGLVARLTTVATSDPAELDASPPPPDH